LCFFETDKSRAQLQQNATGEFEEAKLTEKALRSHVRKKIADLASIVDGEIGLNHTQKTVTQSPYSSDTVAQSFNPTQQEYCTIYRAYSTPYAGEAGFAGEEALFNGR
jgi:hypothetical protein